jgi:glycosyltransferase involved in cell wall biosynthesis
MRNNKYSTSLPLVSVIVPAYNAEDFIAQTLDSIISQTYQNIEILVVDDGSEDRTPEIVESFAQRNQRITLLRQANAGVAAARNLAIEKSSGEYMAPIDADDIWYPQKLEKQVECMLKGGPSVGLVYARSVIIDENNSVLKKIMSYLDPVSSVIEGDVYAALVYTNFVGNASVPLIRRSCLERVGGYNYQLREQKAQGCEDWDIYLRIAEFYQLRVVPEYLIGYRETISSMSCNCTSMAKSYQLVLEDVEQRHPEIPSFIYKWSRSNFYVYLIHQSLRTGQHWSTLYWLYKAFRVDSLNLLNFNLYEVGIKSILKFLAQPVTSLVWKDHRSWLEFKQRFKPTPEVIPIADINSEVSTREINKHQPPALTLYERILLQRASRVLQSCKTTTPQICEDKVQASL